MLATYLLCPPWLFFPDFNLGSMFFSIYKIYINSKFRFLPCLEPLVRFLLCDKLEDSEVVAFLVRIPYL